MCKCPPGISDTSAKSTLLGISCSNTFFIDLYQRLCLQSECGWARYKTSLTQNPFSVPASSVTAVSQAKQTGYSALTTPLQCMLYKKPGASSSGRDRLQISLLSDLMGPVCRPSWEKHSNDSNVMQQLQRVKQHLIQIATGAVLTLTFSYKLRVGLTNRGRDKDLEN